MDRRNLKSAPKEGAMKKPSRIGGVPLPGLISGNSHGRALAQISQEVRFDNPRIFGNPMDEFEQALLEVAHLQPLSPSMKRVMDIERKKWKRIVAIYHHFDIRSRGYIDFSEALCRVETMNSGKRHLSSIDEFYVLLLDILESMLNHVSADGVIEKETFLMALGSWYDAASKNGGRNCPNWLNKLRSDQPNINPLLVWDHNAKMVKIRQADAMKEPFYRPPITAKESPKQVANPRRLPCAKDTITIVSTGGVSDLNAPKTSDADKALAEGRVRYLIPCPRKPSVQWKTEASRLAMSWYKKKL